MDNLPVFRPPGFMFEQITSGQESLEATLGFHLAPDPTALSPSLTAQCDGKSTHCHWNLAGFLTLSVDSISYHRMLGAMLRAALSSCRPFHDY